MAVEPLVRLPQKVPVELLLGAALLLARNEHDRVALRIECEHRPPDLRLAMGVVPQLLHVRMPAVPERAHQGSSSRGASCLQRRDRGEQRLLLFGVHRLVFRHELLVELNFPVPGLLLLRARGLITFE
nr:hypothetical protein [Ramlibacter henchirensis]